MITDSGARPLKQLHTETQKAAAKPASLYFISRRRQNKLVVLARLRMLKHEK